MDSQLDIRLLISMVGATGARAALLKSEKVTLAALRDMLSAVGQPVQRRKSSREQLVNLLLAVYDKRITKSIDELRNLSEEEIRSYLEESKCTLQELVTLLQREKLPYRKGASRAQLVKAAARQISSIGIYNRIATGKQADDKPLAAKTEKTPTNESEPPKAASSSAANIDDSSYVGEQLPLTRRGEPQS